MVLELINWPLEHWNELIQLYLALIGVASIIIKLTPNVKDDNVLKGFLRFTGKFIALNRK